MPHNHDLRDRARRRLTLSLAARRAEARRLAAVLRAESVGGMLLFVAAVAALIIANSSAADWYVTLRDTELGPAALRLTVGEWTSDGLLAVFFFLIGLELKQELTVGELADPRRAAVPIIAAIGGMAVPAAIYLGFNAGGATHGWAIPTATDIAFALAVLAVSGKFLPAVLRTFLLTLAVADDLFAIVVIAVAYSRGLDLVHLAVAVACVAVFAVVIRARRIPAPVRTVAAIALALAAWLFMHSSGVHATIAGVLLGVMIPVKRIYDAPAPERSAPRRPEPRSLATRIDAVLHPISAGVVVPLFAFFAAGVAFGDPADFGRSLLQPVTAGIALGLLLGKAVGIYATTVIAGRLLKAPLLRVISHWDLLGIALVGGVGFTVSLLVGHLAFIGDAQLTADGQIGVLVGSLLSAVVALAVLRTRNRHYRPTSVA